MSVEADVRDATSANDGRDALAELVFERFRRGGVGAKLFLLREIGAGAALRPREVRELFLGFDSWEPSVRVAALRDVIASLDEDDDDQEGDEEAPSIKWPDALVLRELEKGDPLTMSHDESHILAAACLAAARRNIHEATPALERLLGSAHPAPRAAAAAALLSLG